MWGDLLVERVGIVFPDYSKDFDGLHQKHPASAKITENAGFFDKMIAKAARIVL